MNKSMQTIIDRELAVVDGLKAKGFPEAADELKELIQTNPAPSIKGEEEQSDLWEELAVDLYRFSNTKLDGKDIELLESKYTITRK